VVSVIDGLDLRSEGKKIRLEAAVGPKIWVKTDGVAAGPQIAEDCAVCSQRISGTTQE
jgi:hypothetical protein